MTEENSAFVVVDGAALRTFCISLLEQQGLSREDAEVTADVFWQAEMMGESSHGIRLLIHVLGRLEAGGDKAQTDISTLVDRGAIAHWDARRSVGQVTAARAMARAIDKARDFGIGLVTVRNGNSLTSAKYYPLMAANAGMIGVVYTNTSRKLMPPPGGIGPVLGNNPVAYAAPAGKHGAFVLDMACTAAAVERILSAREQGHQLPPGWALDVEGNETRDPERAMEAMALLPFGGHKAFGLAIVHEILTSILAGGQLFAGDSRGFVPHDGAMNTSFTLMAVDVEAFQPRTAFEETMERMLDTIKSSPRSNPESDILFPGERSQAEFKRRMSEGIPLAARTFEDINRWASIHAHDRLTPGE